MNNYIQIQYGQLDKSYKNNLFSKFRNNNPYLIKNERFRETNSVENSNTQTSGKTYPKVIIPLAAGLIIIAFTKGFQKNIGKYLEKFKEHLESKKTNAIFDESNHKAKFYDSAIRKINYIIKKSDSINNITSLKDVLFMRAMYKTKPTENLHKFITKKFEKISLRTVAKSYKVTEQKFEHMYEVFDNLDNFILRDRPDEIIEYKGNSYTKRELINLAKEHRDTVKLVVDGFISAEAQNIRYKYMKQVTSNLYSDFWDLSFKDFWTKDNKFKRKEMWQTFIAAEKIKGDKTLLHNNVSFARNALSYTDKDRTIIIKECINQIKSIIPPNDDLSFSVIKRLEWFIKNSELMRKNKNAFLRELSKLEQTMLDKNGLDNLGKAQQQSKNTCIQIIKEMLNEDATGELQDMLEIYYKTAPFELYKSGATASLNNAVKSFDKSVNLETVELFDKIRDLELGSAPTDVLTVVISFLTISYGLGIAKNKDERLSIILKSGIPIAGAILTSLISATKLISGGKSLALGIASGIALNLAGQGADKLRKHIKFK